MRPFLIFTANMSWRLATSLVTLRNQVNEQYPGRDKSSDGSVGDLAHRKRKSEHNPNGAGVVQAIDIDEDLSPSIHSVEHIVNAIRASRDPRVKYLIYEGRITRKGSDLQQWDTYKGANAHRHHLHISVKDDPRLYDDDRPWNIGSAAASTGILAQKDEHLLDPAPSTTGQPLLKRRSKGSFVVKLQKRLIELGYDLKADGDFGPATAQAVLRFQRSKGLKADARVGEDTWTALGV